MSEYRPRPQIDTGMNVYEAALGRIRWLFDEFDGNVHVSISGGKDSTVVMELAAQVARERGQVLQVYFLDQEAEWQATHDYIRKLKDTRDDIELTWYQVPMRMFNATAYEDEWAIMWPSEPPEQGYLRPPEPDSTRQLDPPQTHDRFKDVLKEIMIRRGGAHLSGMRMEESPNRRISAIRGTVYKWVTWGAKKKVTKRQIAQGLKPAVLLNPIYDWSYRDVWHYIADHSLDYCTLYDDMFRYGVPIYQMRVSSLLHTVSVTSLRMVQELEPQTWVDMTRRYPGVNAYGHVGKAIEDEYQKHLPPMFPSWHDYLEHLVGNLIKEPEAQEVFSNLHRQGRERLPWVEEDKLDRQLVRQVFRNDHWTDTAFAKWVIQQEMKHVMKTKSEKMKERDR